MKKCITMAGLGLSLTVLALAGVSQNRGAGEMNLDSGSKGKVYFPHRAHQERMEDCQVCHILFPQIQGAVLKLKAEGGLKKKQVMNKLCVTCHKKKKAAGEKSGPTTCTKCHKK